MTFLIFDPQNDLIFVHLERSFEQFLIDSNLISIESDDNKDKDNTPQQKHDDAELDSEMELKFCMTLLLAPFISTKRQFDDDRNCHLNLAAGSCFGESSPSPPLDDSINIHFDSIPDTLIAYKNCHQFIFIHLCHKSSSNTPFQALNDDPLQRIYLQRKISIFAQLTFFVFGNALYNMSKHSNELKLLLELVNKWQELNRNLSFLLECLEYLSLGTHLEQQIFKDMNHVEQLIRLHTQALMNERCTAFLLFFHDKLIFKHFDHNTTFRQEDILSLFLLSQLDFPLSDSVTESDECRNPNYHGNGHLVFLKCHSLSIPVPHIYRKIQITDELYLLTINEVTSPMSSILLLSLSTMIESFANLKNELQNHYEFSPKKWTESLKRIVENFQKFIRRNFEPSLFLSQQLNIGSLTQLTELTKNSENLKSNILAREQVDRILTITIRTLYYYYEKLAFNRLHCELLPQCLQSFSQAQRQITACLNRAFENSIDYIRVKYGTERISLGTLMSQHFDLMAFLLIDRKNNYFTFGHVPEMSFEKILQILCHVYQCFGKFYSYGRRYLVLDDAKLRCVYLHNSLLNKTSKSSKNSIYNPTCELFRIFFQESFSNRTNLLSEFINPTAGSVLSHPSQQQYEMFAITKIQTFSSLSCVENESFSQSQSFVSIVEPCEPSLKEIIHLAKNIIQFVTNC